MHLGVYYIFFNNYTKTVFSSIQSELDVRISKSV